MNYGFVKTAVVTPKIKVAHVAHNGAEIEKLMKQPDLKWGSKAWLICNNIVNPNIFR